jgi:hypothetical protein
MRRARQIGTALSVSLVTLVAAAPAPAVVGHCKTTGPRWDLYGIHDGSHRSGKRYLITFNHVACTTAKAYVRTIFKTIAALPTGRIKGPRAYRCTGTGSGDRRNRMFSGSCMGSGSFPMQPWVHAPQFSWDPWFPAG